MGGRGASSSIKNYHKIINPNKPISKGKSNEKINLDTKEQYFNLQLTKEIANLYRESSSLTFTQIEDRIKVLSMLYDVSEENIKKKLKPI